MATRQAFDTGMTRIGTAGWSIPPAVSASFGGEGSHLERYTRVMNCAEINSSFYRPHRESTWLRWADSVPDDFLFSVKAPKTITHELQLRSCGALLHEFLDQATSLSSKLGPILLQLPPKLAFDAELARAFFTELRILYKAAVVIEPRNAAWFTGEADALLAEFEIARCAADPARVAAAAEPGGWRGLEYYRLHGSPRMYYSSYDDAFLQQLIPPPAGDSCSQRWVVFDNTASGAALGDALRLKQMMGDQLSRPAASMRR